MTINDQQLTREERHLKWQRQREERSRTQDKARDAAKEITDSIQPGAPTYIAALFERYQAKQDAVDTVNTQRTKTWHRPAHIREVAHDAAAMIVESGVAHSLRDPESVLHEMVVENLVTYFDQALETRVMESDLHHYVARITAALVDGGASEDCIEVAYGPRFGVVRVLRAPTNEPVELRGRYGELASPTGTYIGMVRFNYDSYDYSFLGTPRKSNRSWRSDGMRTTSKLATLLKIIGKQFYVPSEVLQSARAELRTVESRLRHLVGKLGTSRGNIIRTYNPRMASARDISLADVVEDFANEDTEVLDYLVRKQRTYNRFSALVLPLIDAARERQDELQRIINTEQSKGINA
jgi:hypothetical protein